jgi:hypothetical protein
VEVDMPTLTRFVDNIEEEEAEAERNYHLEQGN